MKNDYKGYAQSLEARSEVLSWISHNLVNYLKDHEENQTEIEHIIDYLISDESPKSLVKMSYEEAVKNTAKWNNKLIKKGEHIKELSTDKKLVLDFKDGFKIFKLIGKNAYEREGYLMRNCVASYYGRDTIIYSLRDKDNMPHCTMEHNQQVKGKGNGDIHPKYVGYVVKFLEYIGMTVGDSEMAHLGYVNIADIKDENAVFNDLYLGKYFYKANPILDKEGKKYESITLWKKFKIFDLDLDLNIKWNFDIQLSVKTFIANLEKGLIKNKEKIATNTGYQSAATNTGDQSAATNTGYQSTATNTGDRSAATNTGYQSAATNTGYQSAATNTGYQSAATNTGDQSAATNTGNQSAATNTGYQSAATNTGYQSAATNTGYQSTATNTGYQSAATNTGDQSAATNTGDQSAATNTGNQSAATNTGYQSAATNTGYQSAATNTGYRSKSEVDKVSSVAISTGLEGKAKGKIGCWIVLAERDKAWNILTVKSAKIDGKILKEDTLYMLKNGEFVDAD